MLCFTLFHEFSKHLSHSYFSCSLHVLVCSVVLIAEGLLCRSHCWVSEFLCRRSWRSSGGGRGWELCHLGEHCHRVYIENNEIDEWLLCVHQHPGNWFSTEETHFLYNKFSVATTNCNASAASSNKGFSKILCKEICQ